MRYYEVIFTKGYYKTKTNKLGRKVKEFSRIETVTRTYRANEITEQDSEASVWRRVEEDPLFKDGWGASVQLICKADARDEDTYYRKFREWCNGLTTDRAVI